MWAIQHYQNVAIDYYYTAAPYPQLFSILISFCYKLLGSVELQLPVRAMFSVFPVALWGAIAVAPKEASISNAIKSIVIMLLLKKALGTIFGDGLADPLMAASLVVAIFLFMQYRENPEQHELLILSLVCAAVAFYTKQPGLIWALFSLPAITLLAVGKRQLPISALLGSGVLLALGLIWVFAIGRGFQNNQGVIVASQHGRSTVEQLLFAIGKHSTEAPLVPMILAAGAYSVLRIRRHLDILILFLLPALLAWLLYGAYNLRLGIHVVALSALLLAESNYSLPLWLGGGGLSPEHETPARRMTFAFIAISALLVSASAAKLINKNISTYGDRFSPYHAGQNTVVKYFGSDSKFVLKEMYDRPDVLLWVPSNYIYGVFYGHTPMMRPDYSKKPEYDLAALLEEIRVRRPNFLFDAGPRVSFGPGSELLAVLAERRCPYLFEKVIERNISDYLIYRLRNEDALIRRCGETVQIQPAR